MDTKIISVVNKKGGVGKSATVCTLGTVLGMLGARTLIVDIDPQCNTTSFFVGQHPTSVADLFLHESADPETIRSCIYKTEYQNVDIIPGSDRLDDISDYILVRHSQINGGRLELDPHALTLLAHSFAQLGHQYDFILVDNTPYFNLISKNSLSASNGVLIPVEHDGQSYTGLIALLHKINDVKSSTNGTLDILGVFFTRANPNTTLFRELQGMFHDDLGAKMLNTYIRQDSRMKKSATAFIPLPYIDFRSPAVTNYMQLILELDLLEAPLKGKLEGLLADNLQREEALRKRRRKKAATQAAQEPKHLKKEA